MRSTLVAILVLLSGPGWGQTGPAHREFQVQLAASVLSAAFAFIPPRALDPVTVQQLAVWGLAGPAALDDGLSTELRDGAVLLLRSEQVLFQRAVPPDQDPAAWGALVADVLAAAARASPAVRAAGPDALLGSFFDEVFNHLDPYSRYVPPSAAAADRARRTGEAGAGLQLKRVGGATVVAAVVPDGPASEAGIRAGDRLVAVDDQSTAGEELDSVNDRVLGPENSDVSLTIRTRTGVTRTIDVTRAVMIPETVFATRAGPVLLIRITRFSDDTDERLAQVLLQYVTRGGAGLRGIVLDLRGNRGGLLQRAVDATDLFLPGGLIATTAGRFPAAHHEWVASATEMANRLPVVVMVDGRSASAAEVMAAALADRGRAVVVGSATLGKGLVQRVLRLPDDGEMFLSWSRVLAPGGWPLQGLGVLPQVCTSKGQDQTTQQLAALERGTQPMAAALARHRAARAPLPAAEILALRTPCPAAEARETDLATARFLIAHPAAYAAAILGRP